jgi:hypothetical protein
MHFSMGTVKGCIPLSLFVIIVVRNTKAMIKIRLCLMKDSEDKDCEEEEDALGEVMELVKSLSAKLERLESEESTEDFPVLEANVLDSSTEDDNEDFITIEALHPAPDAPIVSRFDDYSDEEKQSPTS